MNNTQALFTRDLICKTCQLNVDQKKVHRGKKLSEEDEEVSKK